MDSDQDLGLFFIERGEIKLFKVSLKFPKCETNYLRSTMTTDRSSGIAMLHAHKGMRVDTEAVVNDFAGRSR